MKAIKIKVNFATGKRAGNLQPKGNRNLPCHSTWQCTEKGWEIRPVLDGNTKPYENIEGITILNGREEIEAALNEVCKEHGTYKISNEIIMNVDLTTKIQADPSFLDDMKQEFDKKSELHYLYSKGVKGISYEIRKRASIEEVFGI